MAVAQKKKETTGGFSPVGGGSVLVDSSGRAVGSADQSKPRRTDTSGSGGSYQQPQTTGGFSSTSGQEVIVTPSGTPIALANVQSKKSVGGDVGSATSFREARNRALIQQSGQGFTNVSKGQYSLNEANQRGNPSYRNLVSQGFSPVASSIEGGIIFSKSVPQVKSSYSAGGFSSLSGGQNNKIPFLEKIGTGFGEVTSNALYNPYIDTSNLLGFKQASGIFKYQKEVAKGTASGLIPQTKGELIFTGLSFGAGLAIGGALRGGGAIVRTVLPRASPFIERGVGLIGLGIAGYQGVKSAKEISAIQSPYGKGEYIGGSLRNIGALGVGTYAGARVGGKIIGLARTRGLKEVDVVAPEFNEGQNFPKIKSGQTAGSLREEFFSQKLPGEQAGVPRGFSARVQPLIKGLTESGKPRRGELSGTYVSPDLNPSFLRAGGRENFKLFSLKEFGSLPTVERLEMTGLDFVPGVRSGQRNLRPRFGSEEAQSISKSYEGTGRGVIPFIKSEKEAVIGANTKTQLLNKGFFQRDPISGQRVPIFQRKLISDRELKLNNKITTRSGIVPLSEVYSRAGSSGSIFSGSSLSVLGSFPATFGRSSNLGSSGSYSYKSILDSSNFGYKTSSRSSKIITGSSFLQPGGSSRLSLISPPSYPSLLPPSFRAPPSRGSSLINPPSYPPTYSPPRIPLFPSLGLSEGRIRRVTKGRKTRRQASIISLETGLKSSFKFAGEETGLQVRPILVSSRRKKRR